MAAIVIIEEATFETGARLAGLLAQSLEQFEPVRVILRDDGPLQTWLAEHVNGRIEICNLGNFPYDAPLAERVSAAASFLETDTSDLAYVYGLGATDFALAARSQDRRIVLHACQSASQIEHLLARDLAKHDCALFCDALITAEDYGRETTLRLFGRTPARVRNLGLRVDLDWLSRVSAEALPEAVNGMAERLEWKGRFVVGGGGSEQDAAFFISLACDCPDFAFVWLGADVHRERGQGAEKGNSAAPPANFYALPNRHNVWPSLTALGAYIVGRRENDLTLPLAAAASGIPVIGFTTGGGNELLGRHGILCHGEPGMSAVCDILRKLAAAAPPVVAGDAGWRRRQLDIEGSIDTVLQIVADVRLMEPGDAAGAGAVINP